MSREPIRITREELHRLVWSKTLGKIREELAKTYAELVKACTAMNVPRPVSGEWERIRLGQPVEQLPLPEAQAGIAVEFFLRAKGTISEEELPPLPEPAQPLAPKAVACLQDDLEELLAFFDCPKAHWKRLRTTNVIERLFVEVRRRIRTMCAFTTRSSCERMNNHWSRHPLSAFTHNS